MLPSIVFSSQVNGLGLEVCCTLGMLTKDQAMQLKEAGLTAYNHNLDTSREFYPQVTLSWMRCDAMAVCCVDSDCTRNIASLQLLSF
jgi:biotin synthase-like enzyme